MKKVRQSQHYYGLPPSGGGFLFALAYWLTRKRVAKFFQTDLVRGYVFLQLIPYILLYRLLVTPYRVHIVAAAPEMPVSVLVLQIRMPFEDDSASLPTIP